MIIDQHLTPRELREIAALSAGAARAVVRSMRRDAFFSSNLCRAKLHGRTARAYRLEALRRSGKRRRLLVILDARQTNGG